jgi:hypothetical protein
MSFLKANKIRDLVGKNDWPRYTEEEQGMYEPEDFAKLFAACDAEERLWYEFFLMTGEREQEVMYTYWSDVNFRPRSCSSQSQARSGMDAESVQRTKSARFQSRQNW